MSDDHAAQRNYTVAVDFDGVIHSYTSSWVSAEAIPDPPVPGAIDWLNEIGKYFRIVIFTTRGKTEGGQAAVLRYLLNNGMVYPYADDLEVTAIKPPALIYLDDRAVRFDGKTFPTVDQIHREYVPWNKARAVPPEHSNDEDPHLLRSEAAGEIAEPLNTTPIGSNDEVERDDDGSLDQALTMANDLGSEVAALQAENELLRDLVKRAAPFVNATAVIAEKPSPALAWLADAADAAAATPPTSGGEDG